MHLIYRIKQLMLLGGELSLLDYRFLFGNIYSLWKTPSWENLEVYIIPLFFLFILWIIINFINGLYDLTFFKIKKIPFQFIEAGIIAFIIGLIFSIFFLKKYLS